MYGSTDVGCWDVRMWECGDGGMWMWDVGMWKHGDLGMWRCGVVLMWGCEHMGI
jgi:hypothetical protein